MQGNGLKRFRAPELPPFPKLLVDREKCRAIVSARHAVWQSHERAGVLTSVVLLIGALSFAYIVARLVPPTELHAFWVVYVIAAVLLCTVSFAVLRSLLSEFFARQVFPTKTTFWFTADAIAFSSRLYSKPVVIWRKPGSRPVSLRFLLDQDQNAEACARAHAAKHSSGKRAVPGSHLHEAQLLYLSIAEGDLSAAPGTLPRAIMRRIPVTEVSSRQGTKFTMVCNAAIALTFADEKRTGVSVAAAADIDA